MVKINSEQENTYKKRYQHYCNAEFW